MALSSVDNSFFLISFEGYANNAKVSGDWGLER
jgi:hypothetical protein